MGAVFDAHETGRESYRKTRQNLLAALSFNGLGVAAATTGLVHPVFAMIAMVLSVTAVLANSFGSQFLDGESVDTDFSVDPRNKRFCRYGPPNPHFPQIRPRISPATNTL